MVLQPLSVIKASPVWLSWSLALDRMPSKSLAKSSKFCFRLSLPVNAVPVLSNALSSVAVLNNAPGREGRGGRVDLRVPPHGLHCR